MKSFPARELLERIVRDTASKRHVHGFVLHARKDDWLHTAAAGNLAPDSRFFAASVTKLFVTTTLLKLEEQKKLTLDDPMAKHLPGELIRGLHVMRDGVDRTGLVTLRHLLSNTSGIPDYFDDPTLTALLSNQDGARDIASVLDAARGTRARSLPGAKARYCDTNFRLLGAVIEAAADRSVDDVFREFILAPLGLRDTYMYRGAPDERLVPMFYKERRLELPLYMASIGTEGGIVSTAEDLGGFLEAFFGGVLFDAARIQELCARWRILFSPGVFFYGTGLSMQPVELLHPKRGMLGHWGHSGSFAFFHPRTRTFLTGTINQFVGHNHAARAMIKVLDSLKREAA